MRQYRSWLARSLGVGGCLMALGACSDTPPKGVAPKGDFNNPNPIVTPGGGGSSATGAGGSTDPNRCVEGRANATRIQPRVILVLDGSCSMSTDYPANGAASASDCKENPKGRWAALRNAERSLGKTGPAPCRATRPGATLRASLGRGQPCALPR